MRHSPCFGWAVQHFELVYMLSDLELDSFHRFITPVHIYIFNLIPLTFVTLWSSAFITSKIIVDNASPFLSLSFRFAIVAFIFFYVN